MASWCVFFCKIFFNKIYELHLFSLVISCFQKFQTELYFPIFPFVLESTFRKCFFYWIDLTVWPKWNITKYLKVGCLHPVACTRSGSGFPSNATLVCIFYSVLFKPVLRQTETLNLITKYDVPWEVIFSSSNTNLLFLASWNFSNYVSSKVSSYISKSVLRASSMRRDRATPLRGNELQ
jgi:hypothetical protein